MTDNPNPFAPNNSENGKTIMIICGIVIIVLASYYILILSPQVPEQIKSACEKICLEKGYAKSATSKDLIGRTHCGCLNNPDVNLPNGITSI
jgi:hypothetical protein